ncbi:hypothetical protein OHAE_4163 [Ochrobactrum soli]|uniref:Uncharacterized protein n=1 Tax=Ochrobactrum soli TaxID=2448455 RepID=A0A2P9HB94_9HYPH|nr:hypothetical protein OHAE_4163 [[Ochrobactrum] soli]
MTAPDFAGPVICQQHGFTINPLVVMFELHVANQQAHAK